MFLLLTMNIFHTFFSVSIADFEQVNVSWASDIYLYYVQCKSDAYLESSRTFTTDIFWILNTHMQIISNHDNAINFSGTSLIKSLHEPYTLTMFSQCWRLERFLKNIWRTFLPKSYAHNHLAWVMVNFLKSLAYIVH